MENNDNSVWDGNPRGDCNEIVVGIDFGTSNSCIAVWNCKKNKVKVFRNGLKGPKNIPSTFILGSSVNEFIIGNTNFNNPRLIRNVKTILGEKPEQNFPADNVIVLKDSLAIECSDASGASRLLSPEDVAAEILRFILSLAQNTLRIKLKDNNLVIKRAVIGIPVNVSESKKASIRKAAALSGLEEVHFMVESTAAAMAYGLCVAGKKNVLIFDIGGGTTDLTVLRIEQGKCEVQTTGGHQQLGGVVLDQKLYGLLQKKLKQEFMVDAASLCMEDVALKYELLDIAQRTKERLSEEEFVEIPMSSARLSQLVPPSSASARSAGGSSRGKKDDASAPRMRITRSEFEESITEELLLIENCIAHTLESWLAQQDKLHSTANRDAYWSNREKRPSIDEIVLVGGPSRIPSIRTAIRKACEKAGIRKFSLSEGRGEFCTSVDPTTVVAEGLAIKGALLSGVATGLLKNYLMLDCIPMSLGILSWEDVEEVGASSNADAEASVRRDRVFVPVICKDDPIPCIGIQPFALASPQQKYVSLDIYKEIEECRVVAADNRGAGAGTGAGSETEHGKRRVEVGYQYEVATTVDLPVPPAAEGRVYGVGEVRYVNVVLTMTSEGVLAYDLLADDIDPQEVIDEFRKTSKLSTRSEGLKQKHEAISDQYSRTSSMILILYLVGMAVLYVVVKLFVVDPSAQYGEESRIENEL